MEVNSKSIRLVLRWRNKNRDLTPVCYWSTRFFTFRSSLIFRTLIYPSQLALHIETDQNRRNRSEMDQNEPKMAQENTETVIKMMMMFRFGRRCRGLMLRSLGLNTLGTARHLPWSPVGLRRWLVDVVVSGRLSWLDAKTM